MGVRGMTSSRGTPNRNRSFLRGIRAGLLNSGVAARRFLRDESGQGTLEYVLILTFTVVAASALFRKLTELMDDGFKVFAAQLEKDLKSGRKPLNVWKN